MVTVSHSGHATVLDGAPQSYNAPSLSPDGSRVAVEVTGTDGRGVWLFDMSRHDMTRFTIDGNADYPLWSRDGRRIVYSRLIRGTYSILASNVDGTGTPDTLVSGVPYHFPGGWTRGDSSLVYRQNNVKTNEDIYIVHLADHAIRAVANTPFTEIQPVVSPDGRWVAFASNETGRREIYVEPLDGTGGKTPVSMNGGDEPRWAPDGEQLYYRSADSMYAVSFHGSAGPSIGKVISTV